jgi:hypothetical protein
MSRLYRWLVGKPEYRPGDYYKFYSQLHLSLWQGLGVA